MCEVSYLVSGTSQSYQWYHTNFGTYHDKGSMVHVYHVSYWYTCTMVLVLASWLEYVRTRVRTMVLISTHTYTYTCMAIPVWLVPCWYHGTPCTNWYVHVYVRTMVRTLSHYLKNVCTCTCTYVHVRTMVHVYVPECLYFKSFLR